jgi:hypothetical protein
MKEKISDLFRKYPKMTVTSVIIFVGSAFLIGAYVGYHTASKYSRISYYALIELEKPENFTVYLPLPNLSSKEIEDLVNRFQPVSETEFNNFSPFLNIGYNRSKISVIESNYGKVLKISANGSIFLYSNIQVNSQDTPIFMSINKTHLFLNRTNSQSNITIKWFIFKETPKEGFFDFNYNLVEFCGLAPLQPHNTERFTYLSELHFMDEANLTVMKTGWNAYSVYTGSFDICID